MNSSHHLSRPSEVAAATTPCQPNMDKKKIGETKNINNRNPLRSTQHQMIVIVVIGRNWERRLKFTKEQKRPSKQKNRLLTVECVEGIPPD